MGRDGMSKRAGKLWTEMREAEEKHGKDSREYKKALISWMEFLRSEARETKKKADSCMKDLKRIRRELLSAKERHGAHSPEFAAARKKFDAAEARVNKAIDDIEPIYRAAMSL